MDSEFLLRVYKEQARMLYFYLKKNGCTHEDAEDIVQESYTKFFVYSSGVSPDKAMSYVFTIALNELRNMMKKRGRESVLVIDDQHFWDNFANGLDTEASAVGSEMKREITSVLSCMKETFRQLLVLKYEYEMTYKEIALLLGMKVETVRTYLFRARKEFHDIWRTLHG